MINRVSKIVAAIFCVFLVFGCSGNRFKDGELAHVFLFGFAGHDAFKFCRQHVPNFITPYRNNVNPTRNCIRYQYYTCHINHYCNGDKKCEMEANEYWLPNWDSARGNPEKRLEITKRSCESESSDCNNGLKNDVRCRNLSSEKYQKIIQEEKPKNTPRK